MPQERAPALSPVPRPADARRVRVLLADDQGFWRSAVTEVLEELGHRVHCVPDGDAAWERLRDDGEIDLLLTDWVMPGLEGPELCRRVREQPRDRYLPILLMTSRTEPENLVEALEAGADAFLHKPFAPAELVAQVRVAERVIALEDRLANRIQELEGARARIERDLAHAASVQRSLLPDAAPELPGLECAWHYEPCEHLGGDLFGVVALTPEQLGVYVLDVSGHGTPAALHSVSLGQVMHGRPEPGGLLVRPAPMGAPTTPESPARVAAELNRRFPLIERSGHYFTFLYGVLEIAEGIFRYVRAGHPGPVRFGADGARWIEAGGGVPVGVTPDAVYRDQEIRLEPGEGLLLLTDGVCETRDAEGGIFGAERVLEVLEGRPDEAVASAVDRLRLAVDGFRKTEPRRDDVTIVGLRRPR